eukprot:6486910-Amphidinium_carterae.2
MDTNRGSTLVFALVEPEWVSCKPSILRQIQCQDQWSRKIAKIGVKETDMKYKSLGTHQKEFHVLPPLVSAGHFGPSLEV